MTYQEKLVQNFIKGLKSISKHNMRHTKGKEVYTYKINDIEYTETFIDCCIVDCDRDTLTKWLTINKMFNMEYEKDERIGDLLTIEFNRLDGEK